MIIKHNNISINEFMNVAEEIERVMPNEIKFK